MSRPRSQAHAVIIGINKYQDRNISDLAFARADAEGIYQALTVPEIGGLPSDHIILLLDEEATQRNIRSAIGTKLPRRTGKHDMVYIYYAGHGSPLIDPKIRYQDGMEKYLVPADAELDDLRATGIAMDEIHKFFGWIESNQVIFFIDSCYSGQAGGRTFPHPQYQSRHLLTSEFLDKLSGEGRVVITACDVNEVSLELPELGHGLFTYHLIDGLKGVADKDRDDLVTVHELYEYVYEKVAAHARSLGGSMHPIQKGSVKGRMFLSRNVQEASQAESKTSSEEAKIAALIEKFNFFNRKKDQSLLDWRRAKKFVKTKPGLILSVIGTLVAIIGLLLQTLPYLHKPPELEKYLSLQAALNMPDSIFVGLSDAYAQDSLLNVQLYANSVKLIQAEIQFEIRLADFTPFVSKKVLENNFSGPKIFGVPYPPLNQALNLVVSQPAEASASLVYQTFQGETVEHITKKRKNIKVIHKNYVDFVRKELITSFITPNDPEIRRLRQFLNEVVTTLDTTAGMNLFGENFLKAVGIYHWMKLIGLDLDRELHAKDSHYLQFPVETLSKKLGTSNDLAVLYTTLLSANEVPALVMPVFNHLIVMINTSISREDYFLLAPEANTDHYCLDTRGNIWLPLDMNAFAQSFYEAWFESRNYDLSKNLLDNETNARPIGAKISHQWTFESMGVDNRQMMAEIVTEADFWKKRVEQILQDRGDELSLQRLALIRLRANDTQTARAYLEQCLARNNRSAETYYLLGKTYLAEKNYPRAIENFNRAVVLDSQMAKAYLQLACAYLEVHDTANARNSYKKGRQLDENLALQAARCNPDVY